MSKNDPMLVSPHPVPAPVSMSKNAPKLVPPPGFPPPPVPVRVSMSKNVPKLVPPSPVPPFGSISARPWLIPGYKEDEQRETKLKLTPLSRLIAERKTHTCTSGSSSQMDEKSKKDVTDEVNSKLVSQLTSGTTTSLYDMVNFANSAFTVLNLFGADYGSFYNDVKDLINHKYDLLTADRKLDMLSVSELEEKYLDAVTKEEQCVKGDEQKRAARRIAQAEVEKLSTQMKV
ncbi:hypothetical protein CQW23_34426 [Capsicum baccatum]|uniref:Uncharacterized protein n=1 Tax=Capsicum baccatum TaxID=33114 RepID=A0A2G2UYY5_CAPBA|nr:hypothetical protein CQW23_34426 [Capsicum baccatum]